MTERQGTQQAPGGRFAVVVSRFNEAITEGLLRGACSALLEAEVQSDDVTVIRVPGAFEIPLIARRLALTRRYDAIVCLGCLIKGDTMHFEYIASTVSEGIMTAIAETGVPMTFGVLTTLTEEQAVARSIDGPDNKGREAALAAVEMATLLEQLDGEGHDG